MRAFVCVGLSIIVTLLIFGVWSHYCTSCCDGNPCNPELYAQMIREGTRQAPD